MLSLTISSSDDEYEDAALLILVAGAYLWQQQQHEAESSRRVRRRDSVQRRKKKKRRRSPDTKPAMKITSILVMKCNGESPSSGSPDPVILANATNVSHFRREFLLSVGRTVAKSTPAGQLQSVQHEEYKVHSYNRNGLCALAFMDDHYPVRSAFSLLNKVLDEYQKTFGESWRAISTDASQPWPYLNEALTKYQDPAEADKLLKIQRDLDENKIILNAERGDSIPVAATAGVDLDCGGDLDYGGDIDEGK